MKKRNLLMIPGPIEFDPEVLSALSMPTTSHVAPDFIDLFGHCLQMIRQVFLCPDGQPFILAGSGTLAMDSAGANLVEPGDPVLVVNTGYFSDRFATIAERYGGQVTQLRSPVGGRPSLSDVETALQTGHFKIMTITHVDTSTGVLADVKSLAHLGRQFDTLIIVDGVCSVAGEELRMEEWGVDLAFTASQKAIGVPPGLAILVVGPRALAAFNARKTRVLNYYGDWSNWLPVMENYEARKPAYFGTPAVNLIYALHVSLEQILHEGMDTRFERHIALSRACKQGLEAIGLGQVPTQPMFAAHTMSAPRYPNGIQGGDFLPRVLKAGVILAGGLHPEIRNDYFRIGHMGATNIGDVLATLGAIEQALNEVGFSFRLGSGVSAGLEAYKSTQ